MNKETKLAEFNSLMDHYVALFQYYENDEVRAFIYCCIKDLKNKIHNLTKEGPLGRY